MSFQSKCLRKNAYSKDREAIGVAARLRKQTGEDVTAYLCCFCGMYHIGHTQEGDIYLPKKRKKTRKYTKKHNKPEMPKRKVKNDDFMDEC